MGSFQFLCFVTLTLVIIQSGRNITAQPTYKYHICQGGNYTNGAKFQSNLNLFLSSLPSNVLRVNNGFYNLTIGDNPDKVYGLFLCRGDLTNDICQICANDAAQEIKRGCPTQKEGVIWYSECMLRYSNGYIFSTVQNTPGVYMRYKINVSDQNRFKPILKELIEDLVSSASDDSQKFSTEEKDFNSTQKIYGLAQCTPDLSSVDCKECLVNATSIFPEFRNGRVGGRVLLPSCNVRYELYPFYLSNADHSPAPSPVSLPPPSPVSLPPPSPVSVPPPSPVSVPPPSPVSLPPPSPVSVPPPSPVSLPPQTQVPANDKAKISSHSVHILVIPLVTALILIITGHNATQHPLLPAPELLELEHNYQMQYYPDILPEDHKSRTIESDKSTTELSSKQ